MKFGTMMHAFIYQLTGGRFGSAMGGMNVLLLTTIGRKTGKVRSTPLSYSQDDNNYVITASNAGQERHPGWYFNLQNDSNVTIQVKGKQIKTTAVTADPQKRTQLWQQLIKTAPAYDEYTQKTSREIPVVILTPKA